MSNEIVRIKKSTIDAIYASFKKRQEDPNFKYTLPTDTATLVFRTSTMDASQDLPKIYDDHPFCVFDEETNELSIQ